MILYRVKRIQFFFLSYLRDLQTDLQIILGLTPSDLYCKHFAARIAREKHNVENNNLADAPLFWNSFSRLIWRGILD